MQFSFLISPEYTFLSLHIDFGNLFIFQCCCCFLLAINCFLNIYIFLFIFQVQWDMGGDGCYNTGKGNKLDLRVLDSAPVGKSYTNTLHSVV